MQMIFQDPYASLDPRQTVAQILDEPLRLFGMGSRKERRLRALALLDAVGLNLRHVNRYPHEFSADSGSASASRGPSRASRT